ncbi:hypothetical protein [Alteromonas sp. KUL49]|uniref:hypothetical protein n=1 Tax=Alteromonas sp. KUL49 TaxID=2480798 RepID=UPI00102F178D|nr:hypothetical protein [Alteromonas sp. KUL49]TAP38689.1 hypothetical protein EYS00_14905 [Alteromonas sp. KUL49]GEA12641.1 hypothetical protein KUL49_30160 [Alteromonas sp. KUL49]
MLKKEITVHSFQDNSGTVCFNAVTGQSLVFAVDSAEFSVALKQDQDTNSPMSGSKQQILSTLLKYQFIDGAL